MYRMKKLHRNSIFEVTIFKELFPCMPLFGFYTNDEIGFDFLPDSEEKNMKMLEQDLPETYHNFSSIFVIVSM